MEHNDYVDFGVIARCRMSQQCQYASRYFNPNPIPGYTYLGEGLRIAGDHGDYHSLRIHKDDIEEAVRRYEQNRGVGQRLTRIYPNGDKVVFDSRTPEFIIEYTDVTTWRSYNTTYRPGCALFIDGVCAHKGIGHTEEALEKYVVEEQVINAR